MNVSAAEVFDAHFHIIDPRFPLVANNGYLPDPFTATDYRARAAALHVTGGAVVSGSFQAFDQTYLRDARWRNWARGSSVRPTTPADHR